MALLSTQLRTALWRNFLIKKRGWKRTCLEVFVPLLLVVITILVKLGVHSHGERHSTLQFPAHDITMELFAPSHPITASPADDVTSNIMDQVVKALNITSLHYYLQDDVISREADLNYLEKRNMTDVGIEFLLEKTSGMTSVDGYVIRMPHEIVRHVTSECSFRENMETCARSKDGLTRECPGSQPLLSGLLRLQWAVETALIQTFWDSNFQPPALHVQMMPMPIFVPGASNIQLLISLSMVTALTPLAYCVTAAMVTEKKTWVKFMLKGMGLSDCVFWLSWWLTYLLTVALTGALATVLMFVSGTLGGAAAGWFFLLVLLYGASLLGFGSVLSVFFKSPKIAGCTSGVACVLLGLVYLSVSLTRPSRWMPATGSVEDLTPSAVPFGGQLVFSVFPPTALALGIDRLVFEEEEKIDIRVMDGQFPLLAVVLMLMADCVLYGLLAMYLDVVVPDQSRLSANPCFCLTSCRRSRRRDNNDNDVIPGDVPEGPHIEPAPERLIGNRVIRIRDLSKSFSSTRKEPVFGLNGVDLDVMEGEVTCILGHSGSGKTTLINILAGVTSPSNGLAFVQSLNVSRIKDQRDLASVVAFCPQRDLVLGDLTVEEHMHISGRLRGVSGDNLVPQIGSLLDTFHLNGEKNKMARELTGCQRRRLSLAMALIVDTKVILLDEPTLGMEPSERRYLLKLLHSKKEGRAIVFTTTHMDEADYYSDRTAVLSRGRLRCVGSSDFLKDHFNVGYRLNLTVRESANTERLLKVVRSHVRSASLVHRQDNKLTIAMPLSQAGKFTALFRQLESTDRGAEYLGVTRFGITITTLEQVFWKLGEEEGGGDVFISPLLTPSGEGTFTGTDLDHAGFDQHRHSTSSLRRSSVPAYHYPYSMTSHAIGADKEVSKRGSRGRKLSDIFAKYSNRNKPQVSSGDPSSKPSKTRSKSMAVPSLRGDSMARISEDVEDHPSFAGTALPTSLEERRATVAAFRDFRSLAQQKNLSSVASLKDIPTMPADPMAKLHILDSVDQLKEASLTDPVEEGTKPSDPGSDPDHGPALPLKIGEVLANLQPLRKGLCLELLRLSAMLKLGLLVRVSEKRWVMCRLVIAVVLTLLAVGTSHAVLPAVQLSSRQKGRLPLFGINRLMYRNASGEPVDSLLADLSRNGHVLELAADFKAAPSNTSMSLQSLLDIMESDGGAYTLHYNASCPLALPHLISFLANVTRNSSFSSSSPSSSSTPGTTTTNTTTIVTSNNDNSVTLAPNVSAWLQPWPTVARHQNRGLLDWVPVVFLGLALMLTAATFAVRRVAERKENLRSYVEVIGVSRWMYYWAAATIDVLEFVVPATVLVVLCAVSKMAIFEPYGSVYSLALLVALFVVAGVLWMYAVSFVCRRSCTWLFCLTPLLVLVTLGCFALVIFVDSDTEQTATVLHYVFTVLWTPYIPFGALHYMAKVGSREKLTDDHVLYVFKFDSKIDICFIMLSVDIIALWIVLLVLDKLVFRKSTSPCHRKNTLHADSAVSRRDDSVQKEVQRTQNLLKDPNKARWPKLVVEEASKVFRKQERELKAVDQVTFGLDQGEVLGILGPPDAGKSTLLAMMLGATPLSQGAVYMDSQRRQVIASQESGEKIGYCPHYNPVWEGLTVDQHVRFVGRVKGLGEHDLQCFRHSLYHDLDLNHCQSQKIKQLSNGDRRKLSFAMSMLGGQTFMLVDEPSLGMDIRSRRLYWDAVSYFLKASQRISVITTQSSDEAQRLCTRLAIMVNGQFSCLSTPEELNSVCEETYRLEVRVGRQNEQGPGAQRMDMLTMFLQELFPGLQIVDQVQDRVLFRIRCPGSPLSLATTFHTLESLKRNLGLEEFTFSQTDTEQMFLYYARDQKEGESRFSPLSSTAGHGHDASHTEESGHTAADPQVASPDSCPRPNFDPVTPRSEDKAGSDDVSGDVDVPMDEIIVDDGHDAQLGATEGHEEEESGAGTANSIIVSREGEWEEQTSL